jgi:hypothetical protein
MSDCTDDLPAGIVPRDRSAAAADHRSQSTMHSGRSFSTSIGRSDAASNAVHLSAPSYAIRNVESGRANHASTRSKPLE